MGYCINMKYKYLTYEHAYSNKEAKLYSCFFSILQDPLALNILILNFSL